jgi:hypothetical protein
MQNNRTETEQFWALQTAMAASLMFPKLVVTHRISVHKSAVSRTNLQASYSNRRRTAKKNNVHNSKNNAYNRPGTLHQAAFPFLCAPSSRCN